MPTRKHRPSFGVLLVLALLWLTTALQAAVSPVGKSASRDFFGGIENAYIAETLPAQIGTRAIYFLVIETASGVTIYAYCHNDPVNKFDYLGLHEVVGEIGGHLILGDPEWILALAGKRTVEGPMLRTEMYDPFAPSESLDPSVIYILPKLLNLPGSKADTGEWNGRSYNWREHAGGTTGRKALLSNKILTNKVLNSFSNLTPFELRVRSALAYEATPTYPWGSLTLTEIKKAQAAGMISWADVPTGAGYDSAWGAYRSGDVGAEITEGVTWRELGQNVKFAGTEAIFMAELGISPNLLLKGSLRASSAGRSFGISGSPRLQGLPYRQRSWLGDRWKYATSSRFRGAVKRLENYRSAQVQAMKDATGFSGRVYYQSVEDTSMVFGRVNQTDWVPFEHQLSIRINPHAFREPGGLKSVFMHELAHPHLRADACEALVDHMAVQLAKEIFGHADDIILPFTPF